jgi:hypothetical protein
MDQDYVFVQLTDLALEQKQIRENIEEKKRQAVARRRSHSRKR